MMTPRQQAYYDKIKQRPAVALLMECLGCEPVATEEYKRNEKIKERVEGLIDQIAMAPKTPRHVIKNRKPWEEPDLSWLKPGECPF